MALDITNADEGPEPKRGGWRWLEIRRQYIQETALANVHLPEAKLELENPVAGNFIPPDADCEWAKLRSAAIQRAALSTLKDRSSDLDDRWCSAAARKALENPFMDWLEALFYEGDGVASAPYSYKEALLLELLNESR